ncbi:unnamed protein product [Heterobilharzia americana]|nr:unnamed protein product [Heterobilharzia americana]
MMTPFAILVDWYKNDGFITCWLNYDQIFLNIYHSFLSGSCFIQIMVVSCLNISFLIKIRNLIKNRRQLNKKSNECKEVAASIVLLILCVSTLIASLPQSTAYIVSFILPSLLKRESLRGPLRLAYNIADISWHFIFIQASCNIFLYAHRIRKFRIVLFRIIKCQNLQDISSNRTSTDFTTKVITKNTGA